MTKALELRDKLIDKLIGMLDEGVTVIDKDGEIRSVDVPAQYLSVAAKVAKDFHDPKVEDNPKPREMSERLAKYQSGLRAVT